MDSTPPQESSASPFSGTDPRFQTLITLSKEAFEEQAYDTAYLCLSGAFSEALRERRQTSKHIALKDVGAAANQFMHHIREQLASEEEWSTVTSTSALRALQYLAMEVPAFIPSEDSQAVGLADALIFPAHHIVGDVYVGTYGNGVNGTVFPTGYLGDAMLHEQEDMEEWEALLRSEGHSLLQNVKDSDDGHDWDAAVYEAITLPSDDGTTDRDVEEWAAMVRAGDFRYLPAPDDADAEPYDFGDLYSMDVDSDTAEPEEIMIALPHPDAPQDLHSLHNRLTKLFFFLLYPEAEVLEPDNPISYESQFWQVQDVCDRKATQVRELVGRYLGAVLTQLLASQPEYLSPDALLNFWATLSLELQDHRYRT